LIFLFMQFKINWEVDDFYHFLENYCFSFFTGYHKILLKSANFLKFFLTKFLNKFLGYLIFKFEEKVKEIAKMLKEIKIKAFFLLLYYKLKNEILKQVYEFYNSSNLSEFLFFYLITPFPIIVFLLHKFDCIKYQFCQVNDDE